MVANAIMEKEQECQIWVDTQNNVVFQENDVSDVVEAQFKSYDTITFPVSNILEKVKFSKGYIDNAGIEVNEDGYRSYNIDTYGSVIYEYSLPAGSKIVIYDSNKYFSRLITTNTGTFTTGPHETYIRIAGPTEPTDQHYLRVQNYEDKVFVTDKMYTLLSAVGEGDLKGINNLMTLFVDTANETYLEHLPAQLAAQKVVQDKENELALLLGDMYREGFWKNTDYVSGDEPKLYRDSIFNIRIASQPETQYDINFLDLYSSNREDEFYSDERLKDVDYPDIDIYDAAHLVDDDVNIWAYLDQVNKCYDQPWKTTISINTDLSTISQHTFTDVMSYIADVAKTTKASQTTYNRSEYITPEGLFPSDRLEGAISTATNQLSGESSSWYTDSKGNIIIESQDGQNAMMITGSGFMVSAGKNADGEWNWRSFGTGEGFTCDLLTTGTIYADLAQIRNISTESVKSDFGQQLDIGSNAALLLYATADGSRPAGSLETPHPSVNDSYILIKAGTDSSPAKIDIVSGGMLNLFGGSGLNIKTDGKLNIESGGTLEIKSNAKFIVTSDNFNVDENGNVSITGEINADTGRIAGFTIGKDGTRKYIYSGLNSMSAIGTGIYLGTDGINLGGKFTVDTAGKMTTTSATIGGWNVTASGLNHGNTYINAGSGGGSIYSGSYSGGSYDFQMSDDGTLIAKKLYIADKAIGTYVDEHANTIVTSKGYLIKADFDAFTSEYETTIGVIEGDISGLEGDITSLNSTTETLTSKTKFLQNSGQISINAFTESSAQGIINTAGMSINSNGTVTFDASHGLIINASNFTLDKNGNVWMKGQVEATSLKINNTDISTYVDNRADSIVVSKGYMVKADFDSFKSTYDTTISGIGDTTSTLTNKTQFLQDSGKIQIGAFTETSAQSVINEAGMSINSNGTVTFDATHGLIINASNLKLDKDGNAELTGKITTTSGEIGGFTIGETSIHSGNINTYSTSGTGVYIGTDGINIGGTFRVTSGGVVQVWNTGNSIYCNLGGGDVIHIGNQKFAVDWSGNVVALGTGNSEIAGWTFNPTYLTPKSNNADVTIDLKKAIIDSQQYNFELIKKDSAAYLG